VRRTLEKLGIPRATFYRWYDLYQTGGPEALDDRSPRPDRVWNGIPDDVRKRIRTLAVDEPALSPRELAVRFTDTESYFVSEASVYRLLKVLDLIAKNSDDGHPTILMKRERIKRQTIANRRLLHRRKAA
jgi:putative transposase